MQEHLQTQSQLFRVRRIMFVQVSNLSHVLSLQHYIKLFFLHDDLQSPLALVGILATYSLGTSFAAASISKDTTNSSNAELTDKYTHEAPSIQTAVESIEVVRTRGSRLTVGESFAPQMGAISISKQNRSLRLATSCARK